MAKVTVIQADRNFAADYQLARGRINQNDHERICQGLWDETDDVLAIARFRLSLATCPPARAGAQAGAASVEVPDIGPDPMKGDRQNRIEQSVAACRAAYVKQQAGVPDQTALVWRWHLGALLECATWLKAILARDATPAASGEAIEKAARYVLDNSRRGNASLNSEQFAADTEKLMTAYRDIIGKALASGHLSTPAASVEDDDEDAFLSRYDFAGAPRPVPIATPAASGEIPGGMKPIPMILHCRAVMCSTLTSRTNGHRNGIIRRIARICATFADASGDPLTCRPKAWRRSRLSARQIPPYPPPRHRQRRAGPAAGVNAGMDLSQKRDRRLSMNAAIWSSTLEAIEGRIGSPLPSSRHITQP